MLCTGFNQFALDGVKTRLQETVYQRRASS